MNVYHHPFNPEATAAEFILATYMVTFPNAPDELKERLTAVMRDKDATLMKIAVITAEFKPFIATEMQKATLEQLEGGISLWLSTPQETRMKNVNDYFKALNAKLYVEKAEEARDKYQAASNDLTTVLQHLKTMSHCPFAEVQILKETMTRLFIKVARASDFMNAAMFAAGANHVDLEHLPPAHEAPSYTQ